MSSDRNQSLGIVAMNAGMFFFITSDMIVKVVSRTLPLGEAIFLRGAGATAIVAVFLVVTRTPWAWRSLFHPLMILRLVGEIGATLFYLLALVHMPIANVSSVFQVTPLAMTAGAALFLGERVGPRRWTAIAIGFVGVTIIIRPGLDGFDAWSIAVLIAVAFVALRDLVTARLPTDTPSSFVVFLTAAAVTGLGLALYPFEHLVSLQTEWIVPDPFHGALIATNAFTLIGGYAGLLVATRLAETSAIAPFRYALLVWAFLYGVVVFGQTPDTPTIVGASIVVVTGLYAYWRERSLAAAASSSRAGAGKV